MKSIFKKIALVLAFAMVITMLPVKSASAASDGPQMYKSLLLYLDSGNGKNSDITGNFQSERYASVWGWKENGYDKVVFESANPEVATVSSSKGKVTAVKVGTTTVTATFTGDDVETVTRECKVTVKQNAEKAGLSSASTKKVTEEGIAVGEEYQLVAVRKDGKGNTVTSGRDIITDGVRFESSNPEIFTVGKTKGKIKGVSAGTAKLYVWAVQSEGRDAETGEYPATTEKKEYDVKVTAAMKVEQTAHNAFSITFPDEASAKAAKEATEPSLTHADAAVSEDKNVVKVFKVLHAATDKTPAVEQETYISGISYNKNVVTVTVFDEFAEESFYTVKYQDFVESFKTCKNVAVELEAYDKLKNITESTVEKEIDFRIYAQGANGQKVDITYSTAYGNGTWRSSVQLEDTATAYNAKYVFNGNSVWFYTLEQSFAVKLKATFEDWYIVTGSKANILYDEIIVTPGNTSVVAGNIDSWGIVPLGKDDNYDTKQLAVEDTGYRLAVKANISKYGSDVQEHTVAGGLDDKFTFISSNNDKLSIDKETGEIYPPKSAVDNVLVHVYYDGAYVGSCPVTVVAKRSFANIKINTDGQTKIAAYQNGLESMWYEIKLYDQLGAEFNGGDDGYIDVEVAVSDSKKAKYVEFGSWWWDSAASGKPLTYTVNKTGIVNQKVDLRNPGNDLNEKGESKFALNGLSTTYDAPATAQSIRVVVTATYHSYDGKIEIQRKGSFSFMVKNTKNADLSKDVKSYTVKKAASIDEHIFVLGKENDNTIEKKTATLNAYSLDKDGFTIQKLTPKAIEGSTFNSGTDLANGQATILVKRGSETIQTDVNGLGVTLNGSDIVFKAVGTVNSSVLTVSGGAITVTQGAVVKKIQEGNYVVNLFVGENGKAAYKASTVVSVTDTQIKPQFTWVKYTVEDGTNVEIARQALKLTFDHDHDWNSNNNDVTDYIVAADVERPSRGNVATIKSVTYNWYYRGIVYEFKVDVNRTVTIAE